MRLMMKDLPAGWELVARHGNYGWLGTVLSLFLQSAIDPTSITLTVRETATGTTRKVTAPTDREAFAKIANGQFDHG
jgi:hypothetical protein